MNQTVIHTKTDLILSKHAVRRAQQRGIKLDTLEFAILHGDTLLHAGEGLQSMRISKKHSKKLVRNGEKPSTMEKAKNVVLVFDPASGIIVTVLLDKGTKAGKCYRSQWPTKGRTKRQKQTHRGDQFANFYMAA